MWRALSMAGRTKKSFCQPGYTKIFGYANELLSYSVCSEGNSKASVAIREMEICCHKGSRIYVLFAASGRRRRTESGIRMAFLSKSTFTNAQSSFWKEAHQLVYLVL